MAVGDRQDKCESTWNSVGREARAPGCIDTESGGHAMAYRWAGPWSWHEEVAPASGWRAGWGRKVAAAMCSVPNLEGNKPQESSSYLSPTDHGVIWNDLQSSQTLSLRLTVLQSDCSPSLSLWDANLPRFLRCLHLKSKWRIHPSLFCILWVKLILYHLLEETHFSEYAYKI